MKKQEALWVQLTVGLVSALHEDWGLAGLKQSMHIGPGD